MVKKDLPKAKKTTANNGKFSNKVAKNKKYGKIK